MASPGDRAAEASTTAAAPSRLGRYRSVREVGRGTFGRAVLVEDLASSANEKRVIKYVDINSLSADGAERALNEVAILRQLQHPHIVRFHEAFLADGHLCIVTEFASGGIVVRAGPAGACSGAPSSRLGRSYRLLNPATRPRRGGTTGDLRRRLEARKRFRHAFTDAVRHCARVRERWGGDTAEKGSGGHA